MRRPDADILARVAKLKGDKYANTFARAPLIHISRTDKDWPVIEKVYRQDLPLDACDLNPPFDTFAYMVESDIVYKPGDGYTENYFMCCQNRTDVAIKAHLDGKDKIYFEIIPDEELREVSDIIRSGANPDEWI